MMIKQSFEQRFGENLRRLRQHRNLTQRDLGRQIGIGSPSISLWESGERAPTVAHLEMLCRALRCSADELLSLQPAAVTGKGGFKWSAHPPLPGTLNDTHTIQEGIRLFGILATESMTSAEVQQDFGLTGLRLENALKAALMSGGVAIDEAPRHLSLETQLKSRYGLLDCLVAQTGALPQDDAVDATMRSELVAFLAASHCPEQMRGLESAGIGGGYLTSRFADLVPSGLDDWFGLTWWSLLATRRNISFSPAGASANSIIARLLQRHPNMRGHMMPFINAHRRPDPVYRTAPDEERQELEYARFVLRRSGQVQAAFVTAGTPDLDYRQYDADLGMPELVHLLEMLSDETRAACVGDVLLNLLDRDGNLVGSPAERAANDALVYGIGAGGLQSVCAQGRPVWLLAARRQKVTVVRAVLLAGITNCLVVTDVIAEGLLA
jgi:DNA-binding transcriptional regulator LsrR (DeoR family)